MLGIDQLHPLFVHFPVAFLLLAAGLAFWWLLTGSPVVRQMTTLLLAAGCLGALAAYYTGGDMADAFATRPAVKLLVERHEDFALFTLVAAAVAAGAFLAACIVQSSADRKGLPGPDRKVGTRLLCAFSALATGAMVAYTGHLGGLMVWSAELNRPAAAPASAAATARPATPSIPAPQDPQPAPTVAP